MSFYMLLWGEAFRKTDSEFMLEKKFGKVEWCSSMALLG